MTSREALTIFIPNIPRSIPVENIARFAIQPLEPYLDPESIAKREIRHFKRIKGANEDLALVPESDRATRKRISKRLQMPTVDRTPVTKVLHRMNRVLDGDNQVKRTERKVLAPGTPITQVVMQENTEYTPIARDTFVTAELSGDVELVKFPQPLEAVA